MHHMILRVRKNFFEITTKPNNCRPQATYVQSTSGEPVSHIVSSNNTAEPKYDMLVGSMTYIAHNSLVFYSCI